MSVIPDGSSSQSCTVLPFALYLLILSRTSENLSSTIETFYAYLRHSIFNIHGWVGVEGG